MYTLASSTADIGTFFTSLGSGISYTIPLVLAGAGGLIALGFAWRHITKKVTGKKF